MIDKDTLHGSYLLLFSADVALIVTVPAFLAVTVPSTSTVATLVLLELQLTDCVAFNGVISALSVYVSSTQMLTLAENNSDNRINDPIQRDTSAFQFFLHLFFDRHQAMLYTLA